MEGALAMNKRTKRALLIAVFFGLPALAAIGVAWGIALWSDWRGGMALLTVIIILLAWHTAKDAL
jgi:hypothetical protein